MPEHPGDDAPDDASSDDSRPDDAGPDHTRPDHTRPDHTRPDDASAGQVPTWQRVVERYIGLRVTTMRNDGGPGAVLRWTARAPLATTLFLALTVGAVLVVTFGVPPVSPLFLIPVVCGPVYPWLRLESRAQAAWRGQPGSSQR